MSDDYIKYRGRCRELAEELCKDDLSLTLVRGYYYCPIWNTTEPHWWCTKPNGTIVDPTARQFPSKGAGSYIPFNGMVNCANCSKELPEEEADVDGNYAFCSYYCHGQFVGIF